jgi:hypothetical protein
MAGSGTDKGGTDRAVSLTERRRRALELRRAGATYEQIAAALGYFDSSGARKAVKKGLRQTLAEPAAELRQLELLRLDRLHETLWPRAVAGQVRAIDRVLRIMARRAALLGLDAPLRVDLHALVADARRRLGLTDEEARALFDQMTEYLMEQRAGRR